MFAWKGLSEIKEKEGEAARGFLLPKVRKKVKIGPRCPRSLQWSRQMNPYQVEKARLIAAALLLWGYSIRYASIESPAACRAHGRISMQRSISFAAGQSVLDVPARIMAIAILVQAAA